MYIDAVGTAVPAPRYAQAEVWEALRRSPQFGGLSAPARALAERVLLGAHGVQTRHLALRRLPEAFELNPDALHRRYREHAPELAVRAALSAMERAAIGPRDVDGLLVSTCTGYLCPGLTSLVGERLGLRTDIAALDLVGHGCAAAMPNLATAEALIASGRCQRVLCVCVEVCSAALYLDDDPGVLISACLFGDGAACASVSSRAPARGRAARWVSSWSLANPAERGALRMESRGGLLRNVLSRRVPALAARSASELLSRALAERRLAAGDVSAWIWHAGGRTVLEKLREATGLDERATLRSAEILRRFGNLSSPSVLFVLGAALEDGEPGGWWWMSSFGAGFSCHGALLEVA